MERVECGSASMLPISKCVQSIPVMHVGQETKTAPKSRDHATMLFACQIVALRNNCAHCQLKHLHTAQLRIPAQIEWLVNY